LRSIVNSDKGLGIEGYDPVTYFDNTPQEGKSSIYFEYNGIKYQFIDEENRSKFQKSPASYLPKYGGWCAYAMAYSGKKVEVDPETYKIVDGELYLFYNKYFNNTLKSWNEDESGFKRKADSNWDKVLQDE
jgi:YHS domain-containing protein